MNIKELTRNQAIEWYPNQIEWMEENNIDYVVYEEWISLTGERVTWINVFNNEDYIAYKLRWL